MQRTPEQFFIQPTSTILHAADTITTLHAANTGMVLYIPQGTRPQSTSGQASERIDDKSKNHTNLIKSSEAGDEESILFTAFHPLSLPPPSAPVSSSSSVSAHNRSPSVQASHNQAHPETSRRLSFQQDNQKTSSLPLIKHFTKPNKIKTKTQNPHLR